MAPAVRRGGRFRPRGLLRLRGSHCDLAWLSLLGKPSAVNPDAGLARASHQRKWDIHRWKSGGPGVRGEVVAARTTMPPHTVEESD